MEHRPDDRAPDTGGPTGRQSSYQSSRDTGRPPLGSWGENAFAGLLQISREMDRALQSFFGRPFGAAGSSFDRSQTAAPGASTARGVPSLWSPLVDVRRQDENVVIHAELPGIPRDAIKIECTSDGITLSGQRQETRTEPDRGGGYYFIERHYGSFHRHIPLPEGAQAEQAKAVMRDGVLEITVPVSRDARRRRIEIES